MFKKLFYNVKIFFHALFYGMAGADKVIKGPAGSADGVEIIQQQVGGGGVFADMLEEKQTQQVKETVDAYYRVYKESDNWDTSGIIITGEDENGVTFGGTDTLKKKTKADFMQHIPVFNPDNFPIRTIQDNIHIEDNSNTTTSLYQYDTTLIVHRDNFTPRFCIDKLVKKMVVRSVANNGKKIAFVDLYLPADASQFGKIDAIVVSNLMQMLEKKIYKSDITDFTGFEWYSDKAWNSENICHFSYANPDLIGINKYDGSIVLTYVCEVISDGKDLTEKFKTKELDDKYLMEAPKRKDIDIFTYSRHLDRKKKKEENSNNNIDLDNLSSTTLKLS